MSSSERIVNRLSDGTPVVDGGSFQDPICQHDGIEDASDCPQAHGNGLPARVVVGKNGAYWRDYTDDPDLPGYSMCPVSTDNDPVEVVAVYVRDPAR